MPCQQVSQPKQGTKAQRLNSPIDPRWKQRDTKIRNEHGSPASSVICSGLLQIVVVGIRQIECLIRLRAMNQRAETEP